MAPIPSRAPDSFDEKRHAFRRRTAGSTSSASAASPSTSTRSRSARGWRTSRASPSTSAARRPTPRSAARGSGLTAGLISRVGDDAIGRFLVETIAREGCDVSHVSVDPARLTGAVVLGIKDKDTFPLIFLRENCADMAITEDDIDEAYIAPVARAADHRHALLDRLHQPRSATSRSTARARNDVRTVLDIDYRPVLWGLTKRGDGETRFIASDGVTAHLQTILPKFDLVDRHDRGVQHRRRQHRHHGVAARGARASSKATLVVKRGADGLRGDRRRDSRRRSTTRSTARASRSKC